MYLGLERKSLLSARAPSPRTEATTWIPRGSKRQHGNRQDSRSPRIKLPSGSRLKEPPYQASQRQPGSQVREKRSQMISAPWQEGSQIEEGSRMPWCPHSNTADSG